MLSSYVIFDYKIVTIVNMRYNKIVKKTNLKFVAFIFNACVHSACLAITELLSLLIKTVCLL